MTIRKILHLDLDAFFCAVEELSEPALHGKPFAVGGRPDQRGVVASCSYPARAFGVRSAMPMATAVRLCPDLIIVPHRHGEYGKVSARVMALLREVTPLIEQISVDEAFIEVSDRPEYATEIAKMLQARINRELLLPVSIGVAQNKLVAKIANNIGKDRKGKAAPPNTITVVRPGTEASFLAPLPTRELWGVGPKTAEKLAEMGIRTIGQLAAQDPTRLARAFGRPGLEMALRAQGIDESPIITEHAIKSISNEITFDQDLSDGAELRTVLRKLSEKVARRLRRHDLRGRTVAIKLRWSDFSTFSRQSTLARPTSDAEIIHRAALALFEANWPPGRAVRLLGLGVHGFEETLQLDLFEPPAREDEGDPLQGLLDDLHGKFGENALRRGIDRIDDLKE